MELSLREDLFKDEKGERLKREEDFLCKQIETREKEIKELEKRRGGWIRRYFRGVRNSGQTTVDNTSLIEKNEALLCEYRQDLEDVHKKKFANFKVGIREYQPLVILMITFVMTALASWGRFLYYCYTTVRFDYWGISRTNISGYERSLNEFVFDLSFWAMSFLCAIVFNEWERYPEKAARGKVIRSFFLLYIPFSTFYLGIWLLSKWMRFSSNEELEFIVTYTMIFLGGCIILPSSYSLIKRIVNKKCKE
ncbi:MAG: hypothetical protein Q3993_07080, partial [Filifactor alocis]|nr:hypothetical protein [Filifactor alocis]